MYAIAVGRSVGIVKTWDECKTQVYGFSGAKYKKCKTEVDAIQYIENNRLINRIYLIVPFQKKKQIELLGGIFDKKKKQWYVTDDNDNKEIILSLFKR